MTTYHFPAEAGEPLQGGPITAGTVTARLRALGLPHDALRIACEGDRVRIEGTVPDAATQERIVLAVGNLQGVAHVDDDMVPARRSGLLEAFGGLANLPGGSAAFETTEERVHEADPEPGTSFGPAGSLFHTVQPGETLEGIAQRHFGMAREAWRVREANAPLLADENALRPGMVLRLPSGRPRRRAEG